MSLSQTEIEALIADLRVFDPQRADMWAARVAQLREDMGKAPLYYRPYPGRPSKKDIPPPGPVGRFFNWVFR